MPQISEMTAADYDEVRALWEAAEGVGLDASDERDPTEAYLRRNPGLSVVARDGPTLVGAVLCGYDGRRGYMSHLAVAESHRRNGLGRELVEVCMEKLAETGVLRCNVRLFVDNEQGAAFWQRIGFRHRTDLTVMTRDTPSR
jgi:ribosomal protein S18 acetylase RimI-like enzyme